MLVPVQAPPQPQMLPQMVPQMMPQMMPCPHPQSHTGNHPHQQPYLIYPQFQQLQIPQFPPSSQPPMQQQPLLPPQPHSHAHLQQPQRTHAHPHHQPNTPHTQQPLPQGAPQPLNLHPQSGLITHPPTYPHGQYPQQLPPVGLPQSNPLAPNQQLPPRGQGQNQFHSHGQLPPPPPPLLHPKAHSTLQPQQPQNYPVRLVVPSCDTQPQQVAQFPSRYPGKAKARPPHLGTSQHLQNQTNQSKTAERGPNDSTPASGLGTKSGKPKILKGSRDVEISRNEDAGSGSSTVGLHGRRFNPSKYQVSTTFDRMPQVGPGGHVGRGDFSHFHPDFVGPIFGFGESHLGRFASRIPSSENAGFPSHEFGGMPDFHCNQSGLTGLEGRDFCRPDLNPWAYRFPLDPSNLYPNHMYPQLPSHFPGQFYMGNPIEMGAETFHHHRHQQYGGNISGHPIIGGDHEFRSTYPSFGGLDSFDNPRQWTVPNNGWCRICKVDCEGLEGLELHSQTKEHQAMTVDMVRRMKFQNVKKRKFSNDGSSLGESSKPKGRGYEGRGNKI